MNTPKILIIDDDTPFRLSLKKALSNGLTWDIDDSCYKNAHLFTDDETYSTIILDIDIPLKEGLPVFHFIHKKLPVTPIIVISSYCDHENSLILAGANEFLEKPLEIELLIHTLKRTYKDLLNTST